LKKWTNCMHEAAAVKDWLGAKGAVDMLETRTAQYEKESNSARRTINSMTNTGRR